MKYAKRILIISLILMIGMTAAYAGDKKCKADKKCQSLKACKDVNDSNAVKKCSGDCKNKCANKEKCIKEKCGKKCCMKKCDPNDPNAPKCVKGKKHGCKGKCGKAADPNAVKKEVKAADPNDPNALKCKSKICIAAEKRLANAEKESLNRK
ncbi:MAG: hypothetical protein A2Y12_07505 [Planctomycetes bacterium GWF2_42_9]|nr:MAG: hypothetical protein A2Y12_07505 [Planctomycetes bacterium GWF2_42_9]HAL45949.1 hypothetical protein [Phycisphaerales bacterium]